MKRLMRKCMSNAVFASFALVLVSATANSCCMWLLGQQEEPVSVKAMRKF